MPDNPSNWERFFQWVTPIIFSAGAAFGIVKSEMNDHKNTKKRVTAIEQLLSQGYDHERRITDLEKDPIDRIMTEHEHQIVCRANTTDTLLQIKRVIDESLNQFKVRVDTKLDKTEAKILDTVRAELKMVAYAKRGGG